VTHGPGLAACLALGVAAAKSLALALRVPLLGVNHLRGHAWSPFIPVHAAAPAEFPARLAALLPHLGLIVSGGNTLLFVVDDARRLTILARTLDDAAGEALDKGAKLLGLGYPGGPEVERRAREGRADAFSFPRGGGRGDELDFSFSGLKTSLRYQLERMTVAEVEARRADLCASYQAAVIDALAGRVRRVLAREGGGLRSLGLSGGVANNRLLRAALEAEARRGGIPFLAAESRHTGDNAGMIAFAAAVDPDGAVRGDPCRLLIEPNAPLAP
jgi:N6-L-threonylcarbamoyladenine synthase